MATNAVKLEKAYFKLTGDSAGGVGKTELRCRYNPTSITWEASAEYKNTVGKGYKGGPKVEFVGVRSRHLKMELFLDGRESGSLDVSEDVETLLSWLGPTPDSVSGQKPDPPVLVFHWGKKASFEAHLTSVNVAYQSFLRDGTPVQAKVNVQLEQAPSEEPAQNPTSGSLVGNRTHLVAAGDTLHSIAYQKYDNPTYWRGLAAVNGVDDPLRLLPGTELLVPPVEHVAALS